MPTRCLLWLDAKGGEHIDRLGGAKFIAMLDLAPLDTFWQHSLHWDRERVIGGGGGGGGGRRREVPFLNFDYIQIENYR